MGKIYGHPKGLNAPDYVSFVDVDTYFKNCEKFIDRVKEYAKKHSPCKEAGEEIRFPVADGYARYIVVSLKPVALIHLAVDDAWEYQYAHRLTASDIREKIRKEKAFRSIFAKKAKGN